MSGLLPDGVASPTRGSFNQTPTQFEIPMGVSSAYANLNPSAGSSDLIAPRQANGFEGHQRVLEINGVVTGSNNPYTGLKTNAPARKVGQKGVVVGGADYLNQLQTSFIASQMQAITDQASASALVSAVR